jgi:hypothetical protein
VNFGIPLAVFTASFLYLLLFRRYTSLEPDEGIILQGAQRIMHGQVLYRDFFSYLTPGSYYLLALILKVFGDSLLVARTGLAVCGGLLSVFTYLLARPVCSRRIALLGAYLVTLTCLPWRFLVLHNWDSTLWACAAVYCAVRWMEAEGIYRREHGDHREGSSLITRHSSLPLGSSLVSRASSLPFWAFAAGSFASLTILFEQSKGAGLALGLAAGFAILTLAGRYQNAEATNLHHREHGEHRESSSLVTRHSSLHLGSSLVSRPLSPPFWAFAGFAWPFLLTFAYFGGHHALPQMLADWLWPLHHYSRANAVPYGYDNWSDTARHAMFGSGILKAVLSAVLTAPCFILPVLPLIGFGLLVYLLTPWGRNKLAGERWGYYVLACAAISGLLLSVVAARADILHFVYLGPFLCLMVTWIAGSGDFQFSFPRSPGVPMGCLVSICFTLLGLAFLTGARGGRDPIGSRRGLVNTPSQDQVIPYTQAHVAAGSTIFVYPYLPLYYYLTATDSPTRFDYLQPGMHTRVQDDDAIREIETDHTRTVLFELGFNQKIASSWPNTPIQYVASDPVGDYILGHYRSCRILKSAAGWPFLFMIRKGLPCP